MLKYFIVFLLIAVARGASDDTGNDLTSSEAVQTTTEKLIDMHFDPAQEACNRNSNPQAFDAIKKAREDFKKCSDELMNFDILEEQVNATKFSVELKTLMSGFCANSTLYQTCIDDFLVTIMACAEDLTIAGLHAIPKITKLMGQYACENEKDVIIRYIAEHGFYCPKVQLDAAIQCVFIKTFKDKMPLEKMPEDEEIQASIQSCTAEYMKPCDSVSGHLEA